MAYNAETMSFELPDTDMIYVSGLPADISVDDVRVCRVLCLSRCDEKCRDARPAVFWARAQLCTCLPRMALHPGGYFVL